MSIDVLEKVKQLPPDQQQQVEDFVDYLLHKHLEKNREEDKRREEEIAEKRRQNIEKLKGKIWMADDLNDTPENFKGYT